MGFEWLALAAAFLWAIASLMSVKPAQHLGSFAYSRWRMGCTAVILSSMAWFTGGWSTVETDLVTPMMLSGLIGIFIGDTALFACLNRMGPRQAGLLFSCHAVFSAILGYFLFSESMTSGELIGSALVFSGVLTAIFFGRRGQANNQLEAIKGTVWIGVALGITAAICQALGGIIAKPVMQTSIDPVAASAIRMITAFVAHSAFRLTGAKLSRTLNPMNGQIFAITAVNGFLAMAVGMTLILYALQEGNVGMVALLSSTTPIMLLPILWLYTKQRPNAYAWIGAIVAVVGTGILVR
ncbi:Permease of the drug/metabolite transporter (DMT) superfamily [Vibrio chagasii]|uniref:DMT family transporter n=1 Tax=Vibrio chagasii TaxID=170679 RepID=UPI00338944F2|nr:Permease of the drug/metabolite transporter (DMT) superfamily [Vibrio chagasii]CAH6853864.1 Permease of the drug/metabolite transporter (DMT) superfamily [Vibrio chagasii]CAH6874917.1 Permease of the drug/metabolite transporter (DMT) superfamily [Vibrio chagasii]CAH6901008.1 Permease of the drug/metabolite transporter (DMT) superfamily [Vibrio chagasii]CAH6915994.1 Permease of the drug/metabolite transporter (DMT) superfamily [Vibrio chagasii]